MAKDIAELEMPPNVRLAANKEDNYLKFSLFFTPDSGYWAGGSFEFKFEIPPSYPWGAPVVTCIDPVRPFTSLLRSPNLTLPPSFTIPSLLLPHLRPSLVSTRLDLAPEHRHAGEAVCQCPPEELEACFYAADDYLCNPLPFL